MGNRDVQAARDYHDATKHSYWSVRTDAHTLDWDNEPLPFKVYPDVEAVPLRREVPPLEMPALVALDRAMVPPAGEAVPDLAALTRLLLYSAGITKERSYPGGKIYFRAAACTGALYEIELYVVCGDLPDLPAGVYQFDVADFSLRRLRAGDYRPLLAAATADDPVVAQAPAVILCTGTYWRNAWKYQARTYRHFGWDNGTILANLLTLAAASDLPAQVVMGFVDSEVNRLLDLDTRREVVFSLVAVGHTARPLPTGASPVAPLDYATVPLSKREVAYPLMREMHEASSLQTAVDVSAWRGPTPMLEPQAPRASTVALDPLAPEGWPQESLEEVIVRRGSTRRFARAPMDRAQLAAMLALATRPLPADFLQPPGVLLNNLYLIVNAVEGVPPGAYAYHPSRRLLEGLAEGNFRNDAARLGLEQALPGDASAAVFFLADLEAILARYGNRGYRAVQLEAGILGGRLYLAAYAQRLGASGLTFYDDEVVRFFSPHAEGKSAIFLIALGKPAKLRKR